MDKLPDFYKSLNNNEYKTKWVKLINDNPTKAIKTYHEAFCVDDAKSKGYCDLLQLFRLLGTLEERKASSMDIKDIKGKIVEIGKTQENEQKQHQAQLDKIVEEMKKLQNTAVDADGTVASVSTSATVDRQGLEEIHNALIQLDKKIDDSKSKQPAPRSSDNSNQEEVTKLQQQIAEFEIQKKKEIETLKSEHLQALEKSKLSVEDINKAKEELEKQVKAMNESTSALNDENNRRIENISMSNEENIAKINQLKQELEYAQAKHKAEIEELRKSTTNRVDNIEPAALSAEEPGTAPAEGDINTNEKISCDDEKGTINAAFGIKLFTLYENAKDILHSDMLILIGCLHFYKLEKLNIIKGSDTEKILTDLENALFIQLTKEEYEKITSQLQRINKTLNETFIKICERDTNYKNDKNKNGMAIMVYALLWIFHFNKNIAINASISTYEQIISNKSLFDKDTLFINDANCKYIIAIGDRIRDSIFKLGLIKNTIEDEEFRGNLAELKRKYNNILKENKSVLALLKRRNDWGVDVKHKRFNLDIAGQDTIESPLELTYNDTPLVIPESTREESQYMTHKYNFYGFDRVYAPNIKNEDIASSLATEFDFENDNRPLCFIGYGQSGSGKTSTLIYLDVPGKEQDGIIMQLLNQLDPKEVTVSMIEIYEAEAAKASDESCIGIGTTKHSTSGKIVECNASNTEESKSKTNDEAPQPVQNGGAVKERIKVEGFTPISAEIKQGKQPIKPSMRYITIGEVLDKQFDEKGKSRSKNEEKDKETFTTFKKGSVQCPGTEDKKGGWFYTHNETDSGEQCMDKNFGLKHYILMGFECREIAPTSNNKQSSRSHVVVSLELHWGSDSTQPPRYIYVCDLAGVENEFDCKTSGSADIIRMKAKTKANKNYSNIVGPGNIEEWKKLEEKRTGNIVKYVHKDVHISETEEGPTCWPDGTPNEAGDIDALRLEYSKELMRIFWHTHRTDESENTPMRIPDNEEGDLMRIKVKGKDTLIGFRTGITGDAVFKYFKEKLKKLPIKRDKDGGIEGIDQVKKNITDFFNSYWMNRLVNGLNSKGKVAYPKITKQLLDEMNWDTWKTTITFNGKGAKKDIELLKSVFNPIEMPDCKSSYEAGFKRACDIRTKEGYVINNTLAQLTRDVKRISKYAIKERLEKPTSEKETDGAEESPATYPCLFADTYDEYSKYSKSTHPLMNWYDIDDPFNEDFGSILTAMCLVSDPDKNTDWTIEKKLNLLKTFRFNYCTVLNETFMMRRGDDVAKTPAGNEIYVNNPPLPPYINVGILENSYKEYIFYENDPRIDAENIEKKTNLFLTLCNHFLNLIVKMFSHPIYENDAIKFMQQLGSISNKPHIFFEKKEKIKELFKNGNFKTLIKNFLKPKIEEFINKIKTNNNATFIGTIQTTEQVNRVSDKIVISEALDPEKNLNSIDDENINRQLLKRLFVSSYLTATIKKNIFNGSKSNYTRPKSNQQRELSAILYECLYEIRKLYKQENLTIASKTMKERDMDGMVSAIETAFPLMSRYLDPGKINYNWNLISHMERGESVMKNKPATIYGETEGEYNSYPYTGDITTQTGGRQPGANQRKKMSDEMKLKKRIRDDASTRLGLKDETSNTILIHSDFIPTNPKNILSKFNEILINNLKDEPSLEYITLDVWGKASNKPTMTYATFKDAVGIKKTKISLMQYLVTDDFFAAVYGDYISQTIEKNEWNEENNTFTDFKPVKTAEARIHLSEKLSDKTYDVPVSYPPENAVQRGGDGDGETGEITTEMVVQQISKIGEKIDSLGGIDQSERDKHAQDLAKINVAVTELQKHLTKLYSSDDSISNKLQEALRQLQEASRDTYVAEN
jgi:hypothetical protein